MNAPDNTGFLYSKEISGPSLQSTEDDVNELRQLIDEITDDDDVHNDN